MATEKRGAKRSDPSWRTLQLADELEAERRDWTPEEYAWSCAEDMRGWAMRSEQAARDLRAENFDLRRKTARLRGALREIRMLTVEVGDSVEAATRACDIAMEALGER